jgi:FkbM family methyltransferase
MDMMKLSYWAYLDIGANHPIHGNNFYTKYLTQGARGINVEPNPILFKKLEVFRNKDSNINKIVTLGSEKILPFYVNENHKISSVDFNPKAVKHFAETINIRELAAISKNFELPWVLKIDIEGKDIEVLSELLVAGAQPDLIVIETFQGVQGNFCGREKLEGILNKKYVLVSMTPLNNFYAKNSSWIFER